MKEAAYILAIIGKKSYTSKWMNWEIHWSQQVDTKLKFAAVRINFEYVIPPNLPNYTAIVNGFTLDGIIGTLGKAKNY